MNEEQDTGRREAVMAILRNAGYDSGFELRVVDRERRTLGQLTQDGRLEIELQDRDSWLDSQLRLVSYATTNSIPIRLGGSEKAYSSLRERQRRIAELLALLPTVSQETPAYA